jgi:hypothetical protein
VRSAQAKNLWQTTFPFANRRRVIRAGCYWFVHRPTSEMSGSEDDPVPETQLTCWVPDDLTDAIEVTWSSLPKGLGPRNSPEL